MEEEANAGQRSVDIFTDIRHPAAFSHPEKVLTYIRRERGREKTSLNTVKKALSSIASYSRFKSTQSKYPRMTTRSDDADERWQLDLMNVVPFKPEMNDDFGYLLILMDVFSRRLMVVPLYDKTGKEVTAATELAFMTSGRIPKTISTDSGREFKSNEFRSLCKKYNISLFYTIPNVTHASIVERVIRTLRMKLGKYMVHNNTTRYIDVLGNIVDGYNNSIHSTLSMSPNDSSSSAANKQIALFNWKHRLNDSPSKAKQKWKKASINVGDETRIPILPLRRFRKSHEPSFSEETFQVRNSFLNDKQRPVARFLKDGKQLSDKVLKRLFFYPNELSIIMK